MSIPAAQLKSGAPVRLQKSGSALVTRIQLVR